MFEESTLAEPLRHVAKARALTAASMATPRSANSGPGAKLVLGVVLGNANIVIIIGGGTSGRSVDETIAQLPPNATTHIVEARDGDLLQYLQSLAGDRAHADRLIVDLRAAPDANLQRLAEAFLDAAGSNDSIARLHANAIGITLIARSFEKMGEPATGKRACASLPKWRLKRVIEHIDSHLGEAIRLADLAAEVRLTRMHFAAQFKVATGLRPHEYVLRRRILRAQALLLDTNETIVDIALTVGFQTQSHFTTVFKRFTSETPYRWRRAAMEARSRVAGASGAVEPIEWRPARYSPGIDHDAGPSPAILDAIARSNPAGSWRASHNP